jgi:hypothetical protein
MSIAGTAQPKMTINTDRSRRLFLLTKQFKKRVTVLAVFHGILLVTFPSKVLLDFLVPNLLLDKSSHFPRSISQLSFIYFSQVLHVILIFILFLTFLTFIVSVSVVSWTIRKWDFSALSWEFLVLVLGFFLDSWWGSSSSSTLNPKMWR